MQNCHNRKCLPKLIVHPYRSIDCRYLTVSITNPGNTTTGITPQANRLAIIDLCYCAYIDRSLVKVKSTCDQWQLDMTINAEKKWSSLFSKHLWLMFSAVFRRSQCQSRLLVHERLSKRHNLLHRAVETRPTIAQSNSSLKKLHKLLI